MRAALTAAAVLLLCGCEPVDSSDPACQAAAQAVQVDPNDPARQATYEKEC